MNNQNGIQPIREIKRGIFLAIGACGVLLVGLLLWFLLQGPIQKYQDKQACYAVLKQWGVNPSKVTVGALMFIPGCAAYFNDIEPQLLSSLHSSAPASSTPPNGGGSGQPSSVNVSILLTDGHKVADIPSLACWNVDGGAPGLATFNINLVVTTDPNGTVRDAVVSPQDQNKLGNVCTSF
ncbi:MAG: hypothetical protein P4L77_10560 [Sulfuriferula sp.]|nr:hypothetical protein [Sulfuriferula sp.]